MIPQPGLAITFLQSLTYPSRHLCLLPIRRELCTKRLFLFHSLSLSRPPYSLYPVVDVHAQKTSPECKTGCPGGGKSGYLRAFQHGYYFFTVFVRRKAFFKLKQGYSHVFFQPAGDGISLKQGSIGWSMMWLFPFHSLLSTTPSLSSAPRTVKES